MINYSIVMRSVNANLLEINQAKSRINQAKKEGTTPDPKDLELVKTEKQNAFAISQYTDIMTIEKFAKHERQQNAGDRQTRHPHVPIPTDPHCNHLP